jgi:hypothetical protein
MCIERVTVQPLRSDRGPTGSAASWCDYASVGPVRDADGPPEARVVRELRKVNGRLPRPKDDQGCLDPKSGTLEPLAILLPRHREEYMFAWNGVGRLKDKRTMMVDYKSRKAGAIEGTWKGDCVSIYAPGRTKGRIWVDELTHDVLRLDEQLIQFEYRVPREHWGSAASVLTTNGRFVDPLPRRGLSRP